SNSSASCSEVLPLPRWPISATFRIRSAALCAMAPNPIGAAQACKSARGLEAAAQAEDRPGVQLRGPSLGAAEVLAELAEREVLEVVEGDRQGLALGKVLDRLLQAVLDLAGVERRLGIRGVLVLDRVEQGNLVARGVGCHPQLLQREDRR